MKNRAHPNMFPGVSSGEPAPAEDKPAEKAVEKVVVTDADVGGVAATPAPATAWSNPMLPKVLSQLGDDPDPESGRRVTWALRVTDHLKKHGPCTSADLCTAFELDPSVGINPYIRAAIGKGLIVRADKVYALPGQMAPEPAVASMVEQKPAAEAAVAIAAMRKPKAPKATPEATPVPIPPPAPAPAASAAPEPTVAAEVAPSPSTHPLTGRKPAYVLFIADLQLLAWPGGGVTIQTEHSSVELHPAQANALITFAQLRQ